MTDAETLRVYAAKARDYLGVTGSKHPDSHLRSFLEALPPAARILDLGCGPATASAHMRAAGHDPDPVDASPAMVTLANDTHDIGARLATFDDIDAIAAYDGVWANFSLLHAPRADLPRHLAALHRALRPGGMLHVGMKTGTGEGRDALGRFYTYVTVLELHQLLTAAGFTLRDTDQGSAPGLAGTIDPFVICTAHA